MSTKAMRAALEALEMHAEQYPHMVKGYTLDAAETLRAALAQRADEPVAPTWRTKDHAMLCLNTLVSMLGGDNGPSIQLRAWIAAQPAAPAYVPLSDDDIHAIYDKVARLEPYSGAVTRRNVARAIESLVVARMRGQG